jgi:hypothetical protein
MTGIPAYAEFLATRDGAADLPRRTLARREEFFARLGADPVRSRYRPDAQVFLRNLFRRHPEPGLDDRMLFLLATAKVNQAERFGVGLGELYGRVHPGNDPVEIHVTLQEIYHTRQLAEVVSIFGLDVQPVVPPLGIRLLIRTIVALPPERHLPLTGACEMVGCMTFRLLRDRGVGLFADEPAVADRIRLLYDEILADEIGHVGYIAARLDPRRRAVMRFLYRAFGTRMAGAMPELRLLVAPETIRACFDDAFRLDQLVAELPGRAFAAAPI